MPSFDVVSEVDQHELSNALDQANREVSTRFDFKGSGARFEHEGSQLKLSAQAEFQLKQMLDVSQHILQFWYFRRSSTPGELL